MTDKIKSNQIISNLAERLTTYIFYASVFIFLVAFNFRDSNTGGWVQQFLPTLPGNPPIQDITFTDSLTGYAISSGTTLWDTGYILKTTNSGYNWLVIRTIMTEYSALNKLFFLNNNTGFIASYLGNASNATNLEKTTNGGLNWQSYYWPTFAEPSDLFVLNTDTIWMCSPSASTGGLFRTTNGGLNWQVQYNVSGSGNPNKIYMYNSRIGFMSAGGGFYKTTNSGANWTQIPGENDYTDIYFIDSLRGYKAKTEIKRTTNGGLNWQAQVLPNVIGGNWTYNSIDKFSYYNDSIYGVIGSVWYQVGNKYRAIVYKTINGGNNWGYQIPDTNFNINVLQFTHFLNGKNGWCYKSFINGLKTYTGGDSTIMANIQSSINSISKEYKLYQNYPNPFNPVTSIKYQVSRKANLKLIVYNITGKEITTLLNEKKSAGEYEIKFDGNNFSSGIYFYTLFADGVRIDTKKMLMIK